jgi:hypothetical protein
MRASSIVIVAGAMQLVAAPAIAAAHIEPPSVTEAPSGDPDPGEVAAEPDPGEVSNEPGTGATADPEAPVVQRPTPAPPADAPAPAVSDATWRALKGKRVVVQTAQGAREGELAAAEGSELVLIADDGRPFTVPKADATEVRVAEPETPQTPEPSPKQDPDAVEPAQDAPSDPKDARAQKRKERREKREHALLGAFTAHGAAYAHWRGAGVNAGHAAYAMDWGIGVNPAKSFGMYAMGGGLLGARIDDKSIRANYGHLAFMFAFGGKWYASMLGAGVAFNRLKMETETQKDIGLSIPAKLFGKIPLPKKLYIGIGLSYELGVVRGWSRFVNGIGGQIVFGRW